MSIIILKRSLWAILLAILTLSPLTHALEEALGTPTTVTSSPLAVPIAQSDPATLLEAALQLREAKPALFAGAQGVLIVNVVPGSQAAEKGLQPGDIVIAYAGEKMNSTGQLVEAVQAKAKEAQVVLRFIRGEKVEEIELRGGRIGTELRNISSDDREQFKASLLASLLIEDYEKVFQLVRDNPKLAKEALPPKILATVESLVQPQQLLGLLLEKGEKSFHASDYHKALLYWKQGLSIAQKVNDQARIGDFFNVIGMAHFFLKVHEKSLEYYQKALTIFREIQDRQSEGMVLGKY